MALLDCRVVDRGRAVGPRPTYRRLGGVVYDGVDEERVWSIVCLFVDRDLAGTRRHVMSRWLPQ